MPCKQCGKCCWQIANKSQWKQADLTNDEVKMLMKIRVPHKGCTMVQKEGDKYICLIHKELGFDRKPTVCKDWNCDN